MAQKKALAGNLPVWGDFFGVLGKLGIGDIGPHGSAFFDSVSAAFFGA
jgi:hypothetical protein